MKAVIDTCVIIDALTGREPYAEAARDVYLKAIEEYSGYVTAKSILDIYYLIRRYSHDAEYSRDQIRRVCGTLTVLDTDSTDCLRALDSPVSDYEDAVVAETARRAGADCIVTRNMRDYGRSEIEAVSPEAFLALLNSDRRG